MKNIHPIQVFLFLVVLLGITTSTTAQTYNYVPDSTFDVNGLKSFIYFNNIDRSYGCALQPDEKLVMTGLSKNPATGSFELCITRLLTDGDFDTTFNADGNCFVSMGNQQSIGGMTPKVKIAPDGKIVVVNSGRATGGASQDMMICRLDTNGYLDTTFNSTGVVFIDMLGSNTQPDQANALDIDANGNIYAAGVTRTGTSPLDNDFAVVKINVNGQLDSSFDTDGKKLFNPSGLAEYGRSIKIQNDGKIVLGGNAGANMYLLRFDTTGTLDLTFNTTGTINIAFQLSSDMGDMDIDGLGRIVIAGKLNTSNSNIATARFLPTGAPDNNYGFNGKYTFNIGGAASTITSMHIQNDYKIVLGGFNLDTAQANNFMITRIDTGGTIDLSFNSIGFVSQPVLAGNIDEEGNGMAVMNDGRIMMTGTIVFSSAVNEDIGVFRVKPVLVTGIQQPNNYTSIRPYPNPFTNELIVVSRFESAAQMSDISGRTVLNVQLVPGMNRVDTGHLPAGVYFINVEGEKGLKVVKN